MTSAKFTYRLGPKHFGHCHCIFIYTHAVIKHNKPPIICFAQLHFISEFCRISLKTRHRHRIYSDWLSSLPSSSSREGGGLRCAYRNSIGHPLIKILPWLWHCETINKKIKSRKYHVWTSDLHVHPNSRFITWKEGGGQMTVNSDTTGNNI